MRALRDVLFVRELISFNGFDDGGEPGGIVDSHFSQALAVKSDVGFLQGFDKAAVGHAILANGGVDTGNPQSAHCAFPNFTIAEGVNASANQGLFDSSEQFSATSYKTLCLTEQTALCMVAS